MIPDHYATLRVATNARREVIRAAYLELIRRYHPDVNPSVDAEERTRAITAAYAVLGASDKRHRYDCERLQQRAARNLPPRPHRPYGRLVRWLPMVAAIGAILLLVPPIFAPLTAPAETSDWRDAVGGRQIAVPQEPEARQLHVSQSDLCSSPPVSNLVKRALFHRAARLSGKDPVAFGTLATYSRLLFDLPVRANSVPETGSVRCKALVALELPPGVEARDQLTSLTDTIAYSLQPGERGSRGTISLTDSGSIIQLLATVARSRSLTAEVADAAVIRPEAAKEEPIQASIQEPLPVRSTAPARAVRAAPVQAAPRSLPRQKPSFSCHSARSWAAVAVCNSATLAALDRQMALVYGNAIANGDQSRVAELRRSDRLFLSRRDACSSEACVHAAYIAGMREIQGIASRPLPRL